LAPAARPTRRASDLAAIPGAATLLWLALWLVGCATGLSAHGEPGATGMWAHDDPDAVTLDSWGQEAAVEGPLVVLTDPGELPSLDRKSTRLNSSHVK